MLPAKEILNYVGLVIVLGLLSCYAIKVIDTKMSNHYKLESTTQLKWSN